jgi:hypothetical protein
VQFLACCDGNHRRGVCYDGDQGIALGGEGDLDVRRVGGMGIMVIWSEAHRRERLGWHAGYLRIGRPKHGLTREDPRESARWPQAQAYCAEGRDRADR